MTFAHGHALVVGVDEYVHHPTANRPMAAEDASQVAKVLADGKLCGYPNKQVTLLTGKNANREAVLKALGELSTVSADDTVLLFYSGHGARGNDGNYYLTACDSRFVQGKVDECGISEGELLDLLRQVPAGKMLLLIHACFSGELSPHFAPGAAPEVASLSLPNSTADAILGSGEGRIIITSSRDGQESWADWGQSTSFFGKALVEGLRGEGWVSNNAGFIGAYGLYEYVYETVKNAAQEIGKQQEPMLNVLRSVGPFPVALYHGASQTGSFSIETDTLAPETPVRRVEKETSQRVFRHRVINTGGGAYIEGSVNTGGGDFVGRDQNKVNVKNMYGGVAAAGNNNLINSPQPAANSTADLAQLIREIHSLLPQANLDADTKGVVESNIQAVKVQLEKPEPKKGLVVPALQSITAMLGAAATTGEAVQKIVPMVQKALAWAQQLLK